MSDGVAKEMVLKTTYFIYPQWGALFFVIGGLVLLAIGIPARFLFGVSAVSDVVFGVEALISGVITEIIFRRLLKRKLVVCPKISIPFAYVWPVLCLYVTIARPFEG